MDVETIKKCAQVLKNVTQIEASGNYKESNITGLVGSGIDAVSVGYITKAPRHFDFSFLVTGLTDG